MKIKKAWNSLMYKLMFKNYELRKTQKNFQNKRKMSNKISENTELTLDLKTLIIIVAFVVTVVGMWFALQKDIDLAKELPKPEVSRTEYDLKDQLIRETIMNTQEKVEQNSEKLDKIDEKLYQIIKK